MEKIINLIIVLGIIFGILWFSIYSLGQLFQFSPSLFLKAILFAFGSILSGIGLWLILPKKIRIPLEAANRAYTDLRLRFGWEGGSWVNTPLLSNLPDSLRAKIFGLVLFFLGVILLVYTYNYRVL